MDLTQAILAEIPAGSSVIDVGCGVAQYHPDLHARTQGRVTLLDAHAPYMRAREIPPDVTQIIGDARIVLPYLGDKVFDIALAVDVPEHLVPEEALVLIRQMQRIAKKVILFIPEGNHPQDTDAFNLGGESWQTHRSRWELKNRNDTSEIFVYNTAGPSNSYLAIQSKDWRVQFWPDFHKGTPGKDPGALFMVWPL